MAFDSDATSAATIDHVVLGAAGFVFHAAVSLALTVIAKATIIEAIDYYGLNE